MEVEKLEEHLSSNFNVMNISPIVFHKPLPLPTITKIPSKENLRPPLVVDVTLPEQQQREMKIRHVFLEVDSDGSGFIDRSELSEFMRKFMNGGLELSEDDLGMAIQMVDSNDVRRPLREYL
jgi:hypothetical protein